MYPDLYGMKNDLTRRGIFFCFNGPFSQDLLVQIGDMLKKKMDTEAINSNTVRKIFATVVEQVQNIMHYSAEKCGSPSQCADPGAHPLSKGIIAVGTEEDYHFVACGNMIEAAQVERLRLKLEQLQQMDAEQLKRFYKEQRRSLPEKDSKGAGLGFIELARKASKPIEFEFQPVDEAFSFFSLKALF